MNKIYTGIGSREKTAPYWALRIATSLGKRLAELGFLLRSGGADGMDTAFEKGCDSVGGEKEIYLPWPGFNNHTSQLHHIDNEGMVIASMVHPNWNNLKHSVKKLHTRNVYQIISYDLNTPSRFVLCYTPWDKGGTLQALCIANELNIPIINLYDYDSSLWDISTETGLAEIVQSILKEVLITRYKLQAVDRVYKMITEFKDRYHYLSNFYMSEFKYKGKTYFYVENAFQSYKTIPPSERIRVAGIPNQSKRLGRVVKLRPDWEKIKDQLMYEMVKAKFNDNKELREQLLDTGDAILIEGNYWHDNYWGDCFCNKCINTAGKNKLGQILMKVRKEFDDASNLFYCKLFNNYRADGKCNEMSCEFCDDYYNEERKQWWYHPESYSYFLAPQKEVTALRVSTEILNVDDKIKTRVVNVKESAYDIYCGRGSKYGNPYVIGKDGDRKTVINKFQQYLDQNKELQQQVLKLRGMRLGCFCTPKDCHVDVIAEFIENHYH